MVDFYRALFSFLPASHPPGPTAVYRNVSCRRDLREGITSLRAQLAGRLAIQLPPPAQRHCSGMATARRRGGEGVVRGVTGWEGERQKERERSSSSIISSPLQKDASRPARDDALVLRTVAVSPVSDRVLDPRPHRSLMWPDIKVVRACVQGASLSSSRSTHTHTQAHREDAEPPDEQQRQEPGPGMQLHREAAGRLRVHLHDPGQWRAVFPLVRSPCCGGRADGWNDAPAHLCVSPAQITFTESISCWWTWASALQTLWITQQIHDRRFGNGKPKIAPVCCSCCFHFSRCRDAFMGFYESGLLFVSSAFLTSSNLTGGFWCLLSLVTVRSEGCIVALDGLIIWISHASSSLFPTLIYPVFMMEDKSQFTEQKSKWSEKWVYFCKWGLFVLVNSPASASPPTLYNRPICFDVFAPLGDSSSRQRPSPPVHFWEVIAKTKQAFEHGTF